MLNSDLTALLKFTYTSTSMLTAWLLVGVLVCAYAALWWSGRRARRLLGHLPSYPTLPFIGNLHRVFENGDDVFLAMKSISNVQETTGLPFVLWVGPKPAVVFSEPEDVKAVTNAYVKKPYYYSFAKPWVGNGLVTAPVEIWKRSIKKLAGTFTGSIVDGYQEVFNAQSQKLVDNLREEVGGEPFDVISKYLAIATLETICQTALGVPSISECIVNHEYYYCFKRAMDLFLARGRNLFYHFDCIYRLTSAHKEMMSCISVMRNVSETIIAKRLAEREEKKRNGTLHNAPENRSPRFKSFLDILLEIEEADPSFTLEQIKAEVATIIVGGQETVATTLFFTLLVLGSRPDVQKKVYNEINEIFKGSKRPVEKDDLQRMPYTEAVLCETLRVYPPIPFVMRDADKDLHIKSCTIPSGAGVAVNIYAAGRSTRTWGPDADQYRPERWLNDTQHASSSSFFAFSYGKRACIGKRYAMALMKTMLAYCVREFEVFSDIEHLKLEMDIGLKASSGHLITVQLRK